MIRIAAVLYDAVIQDKPVLILNHRNRHAELLRDTGLALRNPAGMGLEDRPRLLLARNRLFVEHAPGNLVRARWSCVLEDAFATWDNSLMRAAVCVSACR